MSACEKSLPPKEGRYTMVESKAQRTSIGAKKLFNRAQDTRKQKTEKPIKSTRKRLRKNEERINGKREDSSAVT